MFIQGLWRTARWVRLKPNYFQVPGPSVARAVAPASSLSLSAAYCKSNSICARYPRNPSAWHLASYREPRRIHAPAAIYFGQQIAKSFSIPRGESGRQAVNQKKSRRAYSEDVVRRKIFTRTSSRYTRAWNCSPRYICIIKGVRISYILMRVRKPFQISILKKGLANAPCIGKSCRRVLSFFVFSFQYLNLGVKKKIRKRNTLLFFYPCTEDKRQQIEVSS